jgi:hypothetical protein
LEPVKISIMRLGRKNYAAQVDDKPEIRAYARTDASDALAGILLSSKELGDRARAESPSFAGGITAIAEHIMANQSGFPWMSIKVHGEEPARTTSADPPVTAQSSRKKTERLTRSEAAELLRKIPPIPRSKRQR